MQVAGDGWPGGEVAAFAPPEWRAVIRRFLGRRAAVVASLFLLLLAAACLLAEAWVQDPNALQRGEPLSGPSRQHWFGTDELNRDVFARVLSGGRISLAVGVGVTILATAIGTVVGSIAGYRGGRLGEVLMRVVDLFLILPLLPVALVAVSVAEIGPLDLRQPLGTTLVLSFLIWTPLARIVRGTCLSLREAEFVEAARSVGASTASILRRHILPNAAGPIVINGTVLVAEVILVESAIAFLGFGAQPPTPTWGNMLANSVSNMALYPWLTVFPGLAVFSTVLAISMVGDGLRDALDPLHRRLFQ